MKRLFVDPKNLPPWIIRGEDGKLMINPETPISETDVSAAVAMGKLLNPEKHPNMNQAECEAELEKSHMVLTYYYAILKDRAARERMQ